MEACGSAHYWGRKFAAMGHEVVLLPPSQVHPYVRRNKTDSADAKALLEAVRNDAIRPVPIKSMAQQILTALHRFRGGWMAERTARINTLRGVLRELGIVIPVGAAVVPAVVWSRMRTQRSRTDCATPSGRCAARSGSWNGGSKTSDQIKALGRQFPDYERLRTIPGMGPLTATALMAFVGDARRFPTGRHFASYLGMTPTEHSSGLTRHLGANIEAR